MGLSPFKNCYTNSGCYTAPNPSPSRYSILDKKHYNNATLLKVKYTDCTNYEGIKILVFKGIFEPRVGQDLDPHFSHIGISPIARFKPDEEGMLNADNFCKSI